MIYRDEPEPRVDTDSAKRSRAELRVMEAFGSPDAGRGSAWLRECVVEGRVPPMTPEMLEAAVGVANVGGCDDAIVSLVILALVAEIERRGV